MPDVVVHYAMGQQTKMLLAPEIREKIRETPFTVGFFGPDPWFMYKPWQHGYGRGRTMHTRNTGAFLKGLADEARVHRGSEQGELLFSYLAGFMCHYMMDAAAHPYIIWKTSTLDSRSQAHRAFEHTLDLLEMERAGRGEGKHPITEYYVPKLKLPEEMKEGLDRVYLRIYGWKKAWKRANQCYNLFRKLYRMIENPKGLPAWLPGHRESNFLKGFSYPESFYNGEDVENNSHREWHNAYDPESVSRKDFAEMRREAAEKAAGMIAAARSYMDGTGTDREALAKAIGNYSYLSGLDAEDPRNMSVPGMGPAGEDRKKISK